MLLVLSGTDTLPAQVVRWSDTMLLHGRTSRLNLLFVDAMTIDPGNGEGSFQTVADQLYILKQGHVDAVLNGQEPKHLGPGGVCLLLAGDRIQFHNPGDSPAVLYNFEFQVAQAPLSVLSNFTSVLTDWGDLKPVSGRRDFFNEPTRFLRNIRLHAATLTGTLVDSTGEIILVSRGKMRAQVGDKTFDAATGDLVYVPSGTPLVLKRSGSAPAQYFDIQWQ